jgi:hypothetical protein
VFFDTLAKVSLEDAMPIMFNSLLLEAGLSLNVFVFFVMRTRALEKGERPMNYGAAIAPGLTYISRCNPSPAALGLETCGLGWVLSSLRSHAYRLLDRLRGRERAPRYSDPTATTKRSSNGVQFAFSANLQTRPLLSRVGTCSSW